MKQRRKPKQSNPIVTYLLKKGWKRYTSPISPKKNLWTKGILIETLKNAYYKQQELDEEDKKNGVICD